MTINVESICYIKLIFRYSSLFKYYLTYSIRKCRKIIKIQAPAVAVIEYIILCLKNIFQFKFYKPDEDEGETKKKKEEETRIIK